MTTSRPASPNVPSASMARAARAAAPHHLLGECFGRLDAGRGGARAEHGAAGGGSAEPVGEPRGERRLGADHDEVDLVLPRGHDELVRGRRGDLEVGAELRGAGVAGGGEQGGLGGVALQRPGERVLAAAPPDDQDSHFFLNASVNAWAARLAVSTTSFTTAFASFI